MDISPFELQVAAELRAHVARHEVTQTELAAVIGLSQSQTSKILRGVRHITAGQLGAAAQRLHTTASEITAAAEKGAERQPYFFNVHPAAGERDVAAVLNRAAQIGVLA
ncbi:hypothetical protein DEJ21_14385 [Curtobacterium sp. MCSS17_006]|uniref:helix-turn-helix domain-containing protein n=1 Tax=Curtobacterium sp. MCSS17_006 TaxID=2175642 RepID=UPI000DA8E840|nr:helix-turn-helix transcriptional regulator [Curtobacterium sp. MCSS17_006]PZE34034.1 hypothetical protein DEJ21_14385 [Curtobacterium sp. MCSS17_006]